MTNQTGASAEMEDVVTKDTQSSNSELNKNKMHFVLSFT